MNHSLLTRLKMLTYKDFLDGFKLLLALPVVLLFCFKKKTLWLICESENEARDNGYWLFKHICDNYNDIDTMYAIHKNSVDYNKVKQLGKTCEYGSIKHWIYYLRAQYNISSQKGGKPNAAICYFLEVYGIVKNKRVFLQHGITYNKADWLYYNNTKMRLFICGAKPEYEYIVNDFGYPENYVKYTGFSRFDNLMNTQKNNSKKRILVMPTWREWLVLKTQMNADVNYQGDFTSTEYFKKWSEFLNSKELNNMLIDNNIELLFYPHRNMQSFINKFSVGSDNIKLASWQNFDIQDLIINSDLMITDYSSVAFDYAYLRKPIIFYQFDYDDFRKGQYAEGYFDFEKQKMGKVFSNIDELITGIKEVVDSSFQLSKDSQEYIDDFFPLHDNHNCERIIEEIKRIQ